MTPSHRPAAAADISGTATPPGTEAPGAAETAAIRAQAIRALPNVHDVSIHSCPDSRDPTDPGELTIAWLTARSPNSREDCLQRLASWFGICRRPLNAGPEAVEEWLDYPSRYSHVAPSVGYAAVIANLAAIRSWYAYLHQHGACRDNPAARVKAPPRVHARHRPPLTCAASALLVDLSLTIAEASDLENDWRNHCIIAALFHTCLPAATLAALTFPDNLVGVRDGATISLWTGPHRPDRTLIDLNDSVAVPLRAYVALRTARERNPHYLLSGPMFGSNKKPSDPTTRPLTVAQINKIVRDVAGAAGISTRPRLTPCPSLTNPHPTPRTLDAQLNPLSGADESTNDL